MVNFSINGFGRIGRSAMRVWLQSHLDDSTLVAINTSGSLNVAGWAHLLRYDTAYGTLPYPISSQEVKSRILELKQDLANYLQEKGIPGA